MGRGNCGTGGQYGVVGRGSWVVGRGCAQRTIAPHEREHDGLPFTTLKPINGSNLKRGVLITQQVFQILRTLAEGKRAHK